MRGISQLFFSIVSSIKMEEEKNNLVNIVTAPISPADTRYLKRMFSSLGLTPFFFLTYPIILDGAHDPHYNRLPHEGTDLALLKKMGGARFTLELTAFHHKNSVGEYLSETYGVPYERLSLPTGLRDTDVFLDALSSYFR